MKLENTIKGNYKEFWQLCDTIQEPVYNSQWCEYMDAYRLSYQDNPVAYITKKEILKRFKQFPNMEKIIKGEQQ